MGGTEVQEVDDGLELARKMAEEEEGIGGKERETHDYLPGRSL